MKRFILLVAALAVLGAPGDAKERGRAPEVDPAIAKAVGDLVKQLDSESFEVRERATLALMELGPKAEPALRDAEEHPSVEVRSRVRKILLYYREILRREAAGDAGADEWPMLKRGPGRSASDGLGAPRKAPSIEWVRDLPFTIGLPYFDTPLLASGSRLFVVSRRGQMIAVARETGVEMWRAETGEPVLAGPVVAGGLLLVPGRNLLAIDEKTGHERWRWLTDYGCSSSPLAYGGRIFAVEKGEKIVALDPADGKEVWKMRIPATSSAPVAVGDLVVVGTEEGLVGFRASDGQRRWGFDTPAPVLSSPAVLPDRIIVGDDDHHVFALTADRGREIWRRTIPEGRLLETPAVYGDAVLFATSGATFRALRAGDGKDLWTRFVGTLVVSSPCVSGGIAYFSAGCRIHAMYCADGDDLWRQQYENLWSSPILLDGSLYLVTLDGFLVAFR